MNLKISAFETNKFNRDIVSLNTNILDRMYISAFG